MKQIALSLIAAFALSFAAPALASDASQPAPLMNGKKKKKGGDRKDEDLRLQLR